jgi:hypothetical protein
MTDSTHSDLIRALSSRVRWLRTAADRDFTLSPSELREVAHEMNCALASLSSSLRDSERLDWMNEHRAEVEVYDDASCLVQSTLDADINAGSPADYDIRFVIDAARDQCPSSIPQSVPGEG